MDPAGNLLALHRDFRQRQPLVRLDLWTGVCLTGT